MIENPADVLHVTIFEDSGFVVLARILGWAGAPITQASITAITCNVYDLTTMSLVTSPTVTVGSTVYDGLRNSATDPRWTVDRIGYNFAYAVPAAAFPTGDRDYMVEFNFDPTSGDDFPLMCKAFAKNRMAS